MGLDSYSLRIKINMCSISFVMGEALSWPQTRWQNPEWREHLEDMMKTAKEYDVKTGQPDCESAEKKKAIQEIADKLGVKINFPE